VNELFGEKFIKALPAEGTIALVRLYKKLLSPLFPPSCRFYPSCSDYAIQALHMHGFLKGIMLTAWRILRCNPFSKGGCDPVPSEIKATVQVLKNPQPFDRGDIETMAMPGRKQRK